MTLEIQNVRNVTKNYGPRDTTGKYGGRSPDDVLIKTGHWTFSYDDLPAGGLSNQELSIPANSSILSARLRIIEGFTSTSTTTDLTIGLEQSDGTDIDTDGLVAAAEATQTAIATAGNVINGAGALIGTSIGAANGELIVAPTVADLTAGKAELIVEYLIPSPY